MELRPFQPEDAAVILTWIDSERAFLHWSADRYDHYPIVSEDIVQNYASSGPDFWPLTAAENGEIVGHLILRRPAPDDPTEIRLGYIIVDNARRGQHTGSRMIRAALAYARDNLGAKTATLGVYLNNPAAHRCYTAVGFRPCEAEKAYPMMGETWPYQKMSLTIPE